MEGDREVRLCSVNNSLDAQCIVDLMKENGIASYKKVVSWKYTVGVR